MNLRRFRRWLITRIPYYIYIAKCQVSHYRHMGHKEYFDYRRKLKIGRAKMKVDKAFYDRFLRAESIDHGEYPEEAGEAMERAIEFGLKLLNDLLIEIRRDYYHMSDAEKEAADRESMKIDAFKHRLVRACPAINFQIITE